MRWLATILFIFIACGSHAQQTMTWDEFVDFVSTDENAEAEDWSDHMEGLYELHQHPIDINRATLADLEQIPILTERQAEDIRFYIVQYGAMKTLGELLAITSIDATMRRILPLFVFAGKEDEQRPARKLTFKDSKHDLLTRVDVPLYERKGETNGKYLGHGIAHRLRYNYQLGKKVQAGFGFEKDACEPMTFRAGYDHWSGFALVKNMGWLQTAVVGDYRMGWGSGLLINNRFSMGKSAFSTSVATGVTGHRSASESDYLRGAAATIGNKTIRGTAFFSCRMLDGHCDSDGAVTSINTSGLHRTEAEMNNRHTQRQTLAGAHLQWNVCKALEIGATGFAEHYYRSFTRSDKDYKRYYPEGNDFWGASLDYHLRVRRFSFYGETATNGAGLATLNTLTWRHSRRLSLTASQRYYSRAFHSFHSRAFSESAVQNEHGYYLSVVSEPLEGWTLRAYADLFFRPYQIFLVAHKTRGYDLRLQSAYAINAQHTVEAKAQVKQKEVYYAHYRSQKYSLAHTFAHGAWTLSSQAQMHLYQTYKGNNYGFSLQPTLRYQEGAWRAALAVAWFKTDDYYSRIYLSQPSVAGTFPTMFYGHGIGTSATVRYAYKKNVLMTLRYSLAAYFDRDVISSSYQQINSNKKNDISLQVQLKI